ncbi:MAG TPA: cytochrome c [Blastocatellia bacterium]|nr:cytochrome c [Blastocatellia bacterium]
MRRLVIVSVIGACLVASGGWFAGGERAIAGDRSAAADKGRVLFRQHCASCHGLDAKGRGPVAAALKSGPPDLTIIQVPGEKFPSYKVATIIDGEKDVTAHGTRKMPVWGVVFRRTEGDLLKQANIYALVKYIESIQTAGK